MVQRAGRVQSGRGQPFGNVTRGTTNPNRLRRVDRWLAGPQAWRLRRAADPLVVDLGYGASPATAVELYERLRAVRADVRVTGIEIEPERVRVAKSLEHSGLTFALGGFELPVAGNPILVRAFNVLRQYEEADVASIWASVRSRLGPNGIFVDGTCDEIGRRSWWVMLDGGGPVSLTLSARFGSFALPSETADRLPKALIHRNVPGERIYAFLQVLDRSWLEAVQLAPFGHRQRWLDTCRRVKTAGWPVLDGPGRWRLGELTVQWDAVRPDYQGP